MITAAQLRAARGLLDWTRSDLAKAAKISAETVKNIEHGTFRPQETTAEAIVRAFAVHDVQFTENQGVQVKQEIVRTFIGKDAYRDFLDHIYLTMKENGGVIRQFNVSDKVLSFASDYSNIHMERMSKIANLDAHVLVKEGDYNFPADYCSYRWLPKEYANLIPFYVYGNNVSMPSAHVEESIEVISVNSEFMAKIYTQQFDAIWANSTMPGKKR